MCGLAGWNRAGSLPDVGLTADVMARRLTHRGPDAAGSWHSPNQATSLIGCLLLMPQYGLLGAGMALVVAKVPFVIASLVIVLRATRPGSQLSEAA